MEVKTKLDFGQKAFFLKHNVVKSETIELILVRVDKGGASVTYVAGDTHNLNESEVHASKEDLLKSL